MPEADPSTVWYVLASQLAMPPFVPLLAVGTELNVQVYGSVTNELRVTVTPLPPVTVQAPPLSLNESLTMATMSSQSLGFATVMFPLTIQPLVITCTV